MCVLERFSQFKLRHIYREANTCANLLAKAGCVHDIDFVVFITPQHVLEAWKFDIRDSSHTRFISC
jgi:hypothetical protein